MVWSQHNNPHHTNNIVQPPARRIPHPSTPTGMIAASVGVAAAFVSQRHEAVHFHHHLHASSSSSSSLSRNVRQRNHPHSKLWHDTLWLLDNTNCYAHPSIDLSIRPSNKGGTGIIAVANIPANTIALSLPLEEVSMIDIASILDSYNNDEQDAVLKLLKEMWESKSINDVDGGGKHLAILAGIIAHLQLTRYKDTSISSSTISTKSTSKSMYALEQSRRLGLFLDAMPLLPNTQHHDDTSTPEHPFPTHYLYWTDEEIEYLLQGTISQTKAREVRAGVGLVIRELSASFLLEHYCGDGSGGMVTTQTQILNAILSAFTAVTSRSFGDTAGRDIGKGRMLVPIIDMLNHDDETPNVHWTWHVSDDYDDGSFDKGKGTIVVTTLTNIKEGMELVKCYGWRPAWDIAASYGFVPRLKKARWECSAIPLFPIELDIHGGAMLDLTLESNYGILVNLVTAAVDAAAANHNKTSRRDNKDDQEKRPEQLNRGLQIVSLFRPPPLSTAKEYPFVRRQPSVIVGTKIQLSTSFCDDVIKNQQYHLDAIKAILPAFRAAACAISQLCNQYNELGFVDPSQVDASLLVMSATSSEWDVSARELILDGIHERLTYLVDSTQNPSYLRLTRQPQSEGDGNGMIVESKTGEQHRKLRIIMANDVRKMEILVLNSLQEELLKRNNDIDNNTRLYWSS